MALKHTHALWKLTPFPRSSMCLFFCYCSITGFMSSWWISVGLKGFVRLLREVLGLRGGLGTSTGKQGPKEYFLKEKYIYKYWLNLGLGLCVCVFLSDSKWINHLWEDFLPHLLRNTIFFWQIRVVFMGFWKIQWQEWLPGECSLQEMDSHIDVFTIP